MWNKESHDGKVKEDKQDVGKGKIWGYGSKEADGQWLNFETNKSILAGKIDTP